MPIFVKNVNEYLLGASKILSHQSETHKLHTINPKTINNKKKTDKKIELGSLESR